MELSNAAEARLRATLARCPRGLFTDIDGTLSPIAPTPEAAALLPGVANLLSQAGESFDVVAAVSGRAATDARRMVGLDQIMYIGNHGLERIAPFDGPDVQAVPAALPYVAAIQAILHQARAVLLPRWPGMIIEDKGVTGSIHVRATADPAVAEAAVLALVTPAATARGLRVTRGKMVVELRPPLTIDKGTSITAVIEKCGLQAALYLGDDRTDIDAFQALRRLTAAGTCAGLAVAVLHPEAPMDLAQAADIVLPSIAQVPTFLRHVLHLATAV